VAAVLGEDPAAVPAPPGVAAVRVAAPGRADDGRRAGPDYPGLAGPAARGWRLEPAVPGRVGAPEWQAQRQAGPERRLRHWRGRVHPAPDGRAGGPGADPARRE